MVGMVRTKVEESAECKLRITRSQPGGEVTGYMNMKSLRTFFKGAGRKSYGTTTAERGDTEWEIMSCDTVISCSYYNSEEIVCSRREIAHTRHCATMLFEQVMLFVSLVKSRIRP